MSDTGSTFRRRYVEAGAIVGDTQSYAVVGGIERDAHFLRVWMLGDVVQRLLSDAEERGLHQQRQAGSGLDPSTRTMTPVRLPNCSPAQRNAGSRP